MKNKYIIFFIFSLVISCDKENKHALISVQNGDLKKAQSLTNFEQQIWHLKDIDLDTIPGVSLQRAKDSLLTGKEGEEVIIAVLDSKIDRNHESLKDYMWINKNEIPNNGIDDDQNGYIDDIHGWNFLGNKKGENANYTSLESTRFLRKYDPVFKGVNQEEINSKDSLLFTLYIKAQASYARSVKSAKKEKNYANMLLKSMAVTKKELSKYFFNESFTLKDLDSLKKRHPKNRNLQTQIRRRSNFIKFGHTQLVMEKMKVRAQARFDKTLNLSFNERELIGDDIEDITDTNYGNNIVSDHLNSFVHSTEVSSVISSFKMRQIKIMPLPIFTNGNTHDKDIALAIRYAVDNGAKVINMSFGKSISLHHEWVLDAIKYAEKHNVLLISSSGNSSKNLNEIGKNYPTNIDGHGKEISNNFLLVGGSSQKLSKELNYYYTTYGSDFVDVFAPGEDIYVALPFNKYDYISGTSLSSSLTAGVAALLYSYYPNLSVSQIKQIIIDSSVKYDVDVEIRVGREKKIVPFASLSKSGGIVNAYNALIMAKKIANE